MPTSAHCAPIWMPKIPQPQTKIGIMRVTMSMTVCSEVNHEAKKPGNVASTFAAAAPLTPHPNTKMNTGSRRMDMPVPMSTETMATVVSPTAAAR